MSQTDAEQIDEQTTTMVLDRATGALIENGNSGWSTGTGAVLASVATGLKNADRASVNDAGEKVEQNPVDITITNNTNGHETHITADATVGTDYEHTTWTQISMPKALQTTLSMLGAIAPHAEAAILEMLTAAADGASWDDAFEAAVGESQTDEQAARVAEQMATLKREVQKTSAGRQQVSHLTSTE